MNKSTIALKVLLLVFPLVSFAESTTTSQCEPDAIYKTTDSYQDVKEVTLNAIEKYGAKKVLFASDIDNTLLTMDQNLGSDAWFLWQSKQISTNKKDELYSINSFDKLLKAQRLLFDISSMSTMEEEQPELLSWFDKQGVDKIYITSRGPSTLSATLRELTKNGYKLNNLKHENASSSSYLPYFENTISKLKLSFAELKNFNILKKGSTCDEDNFELSRCLKPARKNAYHRGLYMTSGQHKGFMLKLLLTQNPLIDMNYKAIIFIDDTQHHVVDMYKTFCSNTDLNLFNYIKAKDRNEAFSEMDKTPLINKWIELKKHLEKFDLN